MSRKISRAAFRHLVKVVAPVAELARRNRWETEFQLGRLKELDLEAAEARRMAEPHPLEVARAKFAADAKAAAEKDAFQLKDQTDVFISGTTLRERKEEATRAIRRENKNKSSTEIVADLQRKERQANE